MNILEIIFIGVSILVITSIVLRLIYGDSISGKYWREKGYKAGYKDGSTNIRMYIGIYGKTPSTEWVTMQSGKCLDTREKLLEALVTTTKENTKDSFLEPYE